MEVVRAWDGARLERGQVSIGSVGVHMVVERDERGYFAALTGNQRVNGQCQWATMLFQSAARIAAKVSVGMIPTGSGSDGLRLNDEGAHTLAQDEDSCVVYGMPRAAGRLGAMGRQVSHRCDGRRCALLSSTPAGSEGQLVLCSAGWWEGLRVSARWAAGPKLAGRCWEITGLADPVYRSAESRGSTGPRCKWSGRTEIQRMSGHSKWATIKRKKGATDAARGKLFTKLIKEIVISAKMGGGDVGANPRLRKAVSDGKSNAMPAETIQRAIKRGTGELEGVSYEEVLYEGTGPGGTLFLVEGATDNRNRTVAELRKVFDKNNGTLGSSGTAAWAFDRLGTIQLEKDAVGEDQLMEAVLEAGAEDYRDEGDVWGVYMPFDELDTVTSALETAKLPVQSSKVAYVPKIRKSVTGRDAEVCLQLLDALEDQDDAQNVYADFDISDEEIARISEL